MSASEENMASLQTERLHLVTQCEREPWNAFVAEAKTGYITQTWEWGELTHLGRMHRLAIANEAGAYVAVLLAIEAQAPLLHRPYLYAPRGPVCEDPASPAMQMLLEATRNLAHKLGCFMLKIEPQVEDEDTVWLTALKGYGFKVNPYATHPRRSWMVDITVPQDQLLMNMSMSSRQNVRRGLKNLHIRVGEGQADRDHFYRIYTDTAQRDHFFIHPQSHYDEMLSLFERDGKGRLWLAEYEGYPISAQMVMRCGPVTTSMFSASSSDERYRKLRPNHSLQWTAMNWAKEQGCTTYDFRAIAEELKPEAPLYGLYTYKRGYGGYSWLSLATHDLPYNGPLYWAYRQALGVKRRRELRQHLVSLQSRHESKGEKNEE